MASDGGLIALTLLLLAALLLFLYCFFKQIGATKQTMRRLCAFLVDGPSGASRLNPTADDEDDQNEFMQRGRGLFWKQLDEERSILDSRRPLPNTILNSPKTNYCDKASKSGFQSINLYHGEDYSYVQQDTKPTSAVNSSKMPSSVTNGISSNKGESTQHKSSTTTDQSPEYSYHVQLPPKQQQDPFPKISSPSTVVSPPDRPSGPRIHQRMEDTMESKRPLEKSGQIATALTMANVSLSDVKAAETGGSARAATPDFRYTILAEDDESCKATVAVSAAANGNSFRSVSVDGGSGQLAPDQTQADTARRHSLTSVTPGMASPALSIDNPSPTGSISDIDNESILVLDESTSGACSRRTSAASMDSNFERSDDNAKPYLMRAQSSDSIDSSSSILDLSMNDTEIGQLETRLYYESGTQYLHVWILQAYDIKPPPVISGGLVEYWVIVFLLPHQKPLYRTQLQPHSPVLQFHEQFRQRVRDQDVRKLALLCQMYCRTRSASEMQSVGAALAAAGSPRLSSSSTSSTPSRRGTICGSELVGQAKVRLKDVELRVANTLWLSLLPRLDSAASDRQLGELLFSLNYLPTAERLTVVVSKARNIRTQDGTMPEKIMVRVYLVYGAKVSKKKTSSKEVVEGSSVFNESMIFSLSQNLMQKIYLRLSVVEPASKTTTDQRTIGHVTVGSKRASKEFGHWQKMAEQPRKPVSMWHHLSPKGKIM